MGIKQFSDAFDYTRIMSYTTMSHKKVAVDAMTEIWRAALSGVNVNALTDANGDPTMHLVGILLFIQELHKNNIEQIWVFDHNQVSQENKAFHNAAKNNEIEKRRKKRDTAQNTLNSLRLEDFAEQQPTFDEFDLQDSIAVVASNVSDTTLQKKINSLEKQTFKLTSKIINDIVKVLNYLQIKWIEAPAGYEGEAICTLLNKCGMVDAVYSGDSDPAAFGAEVLWRPVIVNDKSTVDKSTKAKKIKCVREYTKKDILRQLKEKAGTDDFLDFQKICMMLGNDLCAKTPRVGPITVFKKYRSITLTSEQEKALEQFNAFPAVDSLVINNKDKSPFEQDGINALVEWLSAERSFNSDKQLDNFAKTLAIREKKSTNTAKKSAAAKNSTKKTKIVNVLQLIDSDAELSE